MSLCNLHMRQSRNSKQTDHWDANWSTLGWPHTPSKKPLLTDQSQAYFPTPAKGCRALGSAASSSGGPGAAPGTPQPMLPGRRRSWLTHCTESQGKRKGHVNLGGEVVLCNAATQPGESPDCAPASPVVLPGDSGQENGEDTGERLMLDDLF